MTRLAALVLAAVWTGACASAGGPPTPQPFPRPGAHAPQPAPDDRSPFTSRPADAGALTRTALELRGLPYRNGGADPAAGFDCSGFVQYVFGRHGVPMPRTVLEQFREGRAVTAPFEPGDLLFFTTVAPGASHVGIALGGDGFVHAPSSSGVVRVERLSAPYWSTRFVGARRPL